MPYTKSIPKCLVKLGNRRILDYQIEIFKRNKIKKIFIISGYKSNILKQKYKDLNIIVNKEYIKTNMVESLFQIKDTLNKINDKIIISYSDIIFDISILKALLKSKSQFSVIADKKWRDLWSLRFKYPLEDAETFKIDKKNNISEIGKKTDSYSDIEAQYIGLFKLSKTKLIDMLDIYEKIKSKDKNVKNIYMTDLLQILINKGWGLKTVLVKSGWIEIDTKKDLHLYQKLLKKGQLKKFIKIINEYSF